mgnify:CR=1 FL=1|jgi:hypothetical protein
MLLFPRAAKGSTRSLIPTAVSCRRTMACDKSVSAPTIRVVGTSVDASARGLSGVSLPRALSYRFTRSKIYPSGHLGILKAST